MLSISWNNLERVLSDWSGTGHLWSALAGVDAGDRAWTPAAVARRAHLILLKELESSIVRWPANRGGWLEVLPAQGRRHKAWSETPNGSVDWRRTRLRGWPAKEFARSIKFREVASLPIAVLSWVLLELSQTMGLNTLPLSLPPGQNPDVAAKVVTAMALRPALVGTSADVPTGADLVEVATGGPVWKAVAEVARGLKRFRRLGVSSYAAKLMGPDGFPDRLFHLSVMGAVLNGLEAAGGRVTGLRPLGTGGGGLTYSVSFPAMPSWDLWFEGSGVWSYYEAADVIRAVSRGLQTATGRLHVPLPSRPDIVLASASSKALVLECKFPHVTQDPAYVASGVGQAAIYGNQLTKQFPEVHALAVGPDGLVAAPTFDELAGMRVGVLPVSDLTALVEEFVRNPAN